MPVKVPEKFATKTLYNPKLVLIHLDEIKDVCAELQKEIIKLTERLDNLDKGVKAKEAKISTSTKP